MTDYIDLGPDDFVQNGDEWSYKENGFSKCEKLIGRSVADFPIEAYRFRRPRSTLIRDAAIDLLRWYLYAGASGITSAKFEKLKAAVGLTDEELRGEA